MCAHTNRYKGNFPNTQVDNQGIFPMDVIFPEKYYNCMDSSLQKRVRLRMDTLNMNALQTAKTAGLGDSFVRDILRGKTKSPSAENLAKLAAALETTVEYLIGSSNDNDVNDVGEIELPLEGIPVVSTVSAGTWLEVTVFDGDEDPVVLPLARDRRFPRARHYALLVHGDSMDLEYPDGSYAICVDFADSGVQIKSGLRVHIERQRAGGQLVEITIKAIERTGDDFYLVPKSTNEKWEAMPIGGTEDVDIIIKGLVIGGYKPTPV